MPGEPPPKITLIITRMMVAEDTCPRDVDLNIDKLNHVDNQLIVLTSNSYK